MFSTLFFSQLTRRQKQVLIAVFVLAFAWILLRVFTVDMFTETKARDSIHGDAYSDKNTYSAVKYFVDFGFSKSSYLPVHQYDGDKNEQNIKVYTHYPALPDILAGFYAVVAGTIDEPILRLFPVLISMFFFGLIFQTLWKITDDIPTAFVSGLLIVGSNYFLFWADNLHKHLYEELFKWIFLLCMFQYYSGNKNKMLLVIAWIFFVAATNVSFEPVTYLAVLTVGMSWIFERKIFSLETIILGLAPFVGLGLHLWQNVDHFGSLQLALDDLRGAASMRATGDSESEMKRSLNIYDYLSIPYVWSLRVERFFVIPGISLAILGYFAWKKWSEENKPLLKNLMLVLILATLSWNFAMTQHSLVHSFTTRHIGILFALIAGAGLLRYRIQLQEDWATGVWYRRAFHVVFIGYTMVMLLTQQVWDLWRYNG